MASLCPQPRLADTVLREGLAIKPPYDQIRRAAPAKPMAGPGFEPGKAEPMRLQRIPFDRSGIPPGASESSPKGLFSALHTA